MESFRHRGLKEMIADFYSHRGWTVQLEAPGNGWRADVFISKGSRQAVFEIKKNMSAVISIGAMIAVIIVEPGYQQRFGIRAIKNGIGKVIITVSADQPLLI